MENLINIDDYSQYSDEALVLLVHKGDKFAQDFIIKKYKNLVRSKAKAYFIKGADIEDVIQEGMIGLYKSIRDYNIEKKVTFYFFASICISRQIITAIKTATRQKHIPLNCSLSLDKQTESEEQQTFIDISAVNEVTNPEYVLIQKENKICIESYVNEMLSHLECQVLSLYLQGKSYLNIGKMLNKDEKSIDNAIQRIRKKLDKVLKDRDLYGLENKLKKLDVK